MRTYQKSIQTNADDEMTLKFVKYLYRRALECSFAQMRRKFSRILFLNATPSN